MARDGSRVRVSAAAGRVGADRRGVLRDGGRLVGRRGIVRHWGRGLILILCCCVRTFNRAGEYGSIT